MPDIHDTIELLAPAGGPDALIAAVNNGADAVYLGLSDLNARRGASNFDLASLAEATRFAHLRGARVYLTANVVILPDELPGALAMIDSAWAAGVDAVIVQDLGLLRVVRQALPGVRLHASTQIDAMNPDAVLALAEAGVSRVTLARELSLEAIAACAATGVEVETFVHGAICYSYSGQCLMSSMIGRRSANRGLCAQPCRLTYSLLDPVGNEMDVPGRYLLSPRDMAGIAHLPALAAAGVRALKIEGRMKSPEYVAVVTGVYRAALDRALADPEAYAVAPAEWEMLAEAFSRGFTDAYLTDMRGAELMSYTRPNNRGVLVGRVQTAEGGRAVVELERALDAGDTLEVWTRSGRFAQSAGQMRMGTALTGAAPAGSRVEIAFGQPVSAGDRVFRVANATLLEAARRTFTGSTADHRATRVDLEVRVRLGQPLRLAAQAGEHRVEVEGSLVEPARTKPITSNQIVEHVGRFGGSGYRAGGWRIDLDAEAGLGFSALHALRREALERLDAIRLEPWSGRVTHAPRVPSLPAPASRPKRVALVAVAWDEATAAACREAGADKVLVRRFAERGSSGEACDALPTGTVPLLPRVVWPAEAARYDDCMAAGTVVGNLGLLHRAEDAIEADWPLNALNAHAASALAEMGAGFIWASPELSGRQLAAIAASSPVPIGCVVWGRTELMVSEQCVLQASGPCARRCASCARRKGWWRLRDQKGYEFPVTTDASGRSHIMNSVTLDLTRALGEIIAAGVSAVRADFSDESPARAREVISALRAALTTVESGGESPSEPLVQPSTSGHFYRGLT